MAQAAETLKVGYIPVLGSSQLFVIDGEGWARQAGLDLQLVRFQAGTQAIQALSSGKIDVYVAGVLPLLVARSKGVDVKVVAAAAVEELEIVARGPLAAGLPSAGADPAQVKTLIRDFTASQGHKPKIAAQPLGSVPDTLLRFWLQKDLGVDPAAADITAIDIDAAQQAFLSGAVDAAVLREPALTVVRDRVPEARLLATGTQILDHQPGSVLAVYNPDQADRKIWVRTLVSLFVRATDLINDKPKEAAPFITAALAGGILKQDTIERALASSGSHFISDPAVLVEPVRQLQDFEVAAGILRNPAPVETLFDLEPYASLKP
ncbi:MAG: ABC transporter substrate-binding protein [Azospirillaceae bacterium]|nr:ABC transporter substrate-binding protein [Azospirillaceae bacterium]